MHHDIKQLRAKYKGIRCECSDPGCATGHGNRECGRLATSRMFHIDMEDRTGTFMCNECSEDAWSYGLFRSRDVHVEMRHGYRNETTRRLWRAVWQGDEDAMPILADALEDAGYRDQSILKRLRRKDRTALQYLNMEPRGMGD